MAETKDLPLWRSMMFVPANVPKFVEKAHTRGADAIIIDLEDSVLPDDKAAARKLVPEVAAAVGQAGADVCVRLNRPWRLAVPDVEASVCPGVAALVLPKVADAGHVRAIAEIVDEVEVEKGMPAGHTRLVAMIETADAFFHVRDIAGAHARVVGMILGSEDFANSAGMAPEPDGLFHPTVETAIAARAAGILPLGFVGSLVGYSDLDEFRAMVRRGRNLGFEGAFCIHPAQVPILNEEYAPSADDVDYARRVIAAADEAASAGRGSATVDGKMIDIPIVDRARLTLQRQAQIEARTG